MLNAWLLHRESVEICVIHSDSGSAIAFSLVESDIYHINLLLPFSTKMVIQDCRIKNALSMRNTWTLTKETNSFDRHHTFC